MQTNLALFTDLYELSMAQAYFDEAMTEKAVFSLFVRRLPSRRNYLLACGLDTVLDYLENLRFEEEDIAYLASLGKFSERFLDYLRDFRFSGSVYAVPEGTPVFANEPLLEVEAPLLEAQIIETFVMNQMHVQTVLASKAQRLVTAAEGRPVIDFGPRRMHGVDAALKAARAFYIGGVAATSNVLAGKVYQVPVAGTMAHSYIQAHDDEREAFRNFVHLYPNTILLVDTYDTLEGVRRAIELSETLGEEFKIRGVRLDSGDLLKLSREVRQLLDQAGMSHVEILVSGGLDEDKIADLVAAQAPIDGYGVGTSMGVSQDAPDLDIAYKLCEYAGKGRLKLSTGKPILPGRKQVFRVSDQGEFQQDVIARVDEDQPGRPLLEAVMQEGKRLEAGRVSLESARAYASEQLASLPDSVRAIRPPESPYSVKISSRLSDYQKEVEDRVQESMEVV
ncbi:nicotinate phosphoribosyltransferase [Marinospirillum sp.]|uniref:nicotinate phosphoribosyltransferase n=1 Tax=Marinospirillum sp. TaxID=2183934 RepID=UPI00287099A1|nr:nicotinate phosphoribosyltransferase [Marinospirillum sp.]MDR9467905.1 nicotinate phosphoribosyltransferase [Marinospirillum sp.]